MSGVIWKFKVGAELPGSILVPEDSRVLHIGNDPEGIICAWALVPNRQAGLVPLAVQVIGTGGTTPVGDWTYLNTWVDGPMVFHTFIEGTQP